MNKLLCGLASASLLSASGALAQPSTQLAITQPTILSNTELDRVNAGFLEIDRSNTSYTVVSLFQTPSMFVSIPNTIDCQGCYLLIITPRMSIGSRFGP